MSPIEHDPTHRSVIGEEPRSRKRWRVTLAGALLVLLVAWLALGPRRTPQAGGTRAEESVVHAARDRGGRTPRHHEPGPRRLDPPTPAAPTGEIVVDGVDVDKTEICEGEEIVVSIRARTTDHTDEYLSYSGLERLDLQGSRFAFRPTESIGIDTLKLLVRGRGGASAIASVPPVLLKDCGARARLEIGLERRAAAQDRAWLTASITSSRPTTPGEGAQASADAFQPVEYEWDFGDGARLLTKTERTEHSYEARPQTSAYSYFFVTVTARDAARRELRASRSLRFVNLGFHPLANEDRVTIFAGIQPTSDRGGHEKIWLYHGAPFAVRLDRVVVSEVAADAAGNETSSPVGEYEPSALLGFAELPPGQSLPVQDLSALYPKIPGQVRVVELRGQFPRGKTVNGAFTLVAPPAPENEHGALDPSAIEERDYTSARAGRED